VWVVSSVVWIGPQYGQWHEADGAWQGSSLPRSSGWYWSRSSPAARDPVPASFERGGRGAW